MALSRREFKLAKFQTKQQEKTARTDIRQASRTTRNADRKAADAAAYAAGIDPKAAMWKGITSLAETAGGVVTKGIGLNAASKATIGVANATSAATAAVAKSASDTADSLFNSKNLLTVGGIVGGIFLLSKL